MKISILLPFRNAAPWIVETIQSIQDQTHENWELLAVNDHSTDGTLSLIRSAEDPRIQILTNEDEGIIPALQTGLKAATGAFTTRMDADDLMPKDKLKLLLSAIEGQRHVVTGKVRYFSDSVVSEGYKKYEDWLNERCDQKDHFDHVYRECVVASPNWLVATKFLRQDKIFDQLQYPEDYDMTFLWKRLGYEIGVVNEVTHLWREHPQRTSRNSQTYNQASFFHLKLSWFQRNEKGKTLGVFGTGSKGKMVIDQLKDAYEIHWFDHEHSRYGAPLNGYAIEDPMKCNCDLLLLAIYPENKMRLENLVTHLGYEFGKTVWYV
ncbi:MAG: glycosyltransferase [Crocinitomicaceae bacterium]